MQFENIVKTVEIDVEDWVSKGWIKDASELDDFIHQCTRQQTENLVYTLVGATREKLTKEYFPKAA